MLLALPQPLVLPQGAKILVTSQISQTYGTTVPWSPLPPLPASRIEALESAALAWFSTAWTHIPLASLTGAGPPEVTLFHRAAHPPRAGKRLRLRTLAPAHSERRRPHLWLPAGRTAFPRRQRVRLTLDPWVFFRCLSSCGPYVVSRTYPKIKISGGIHSFQPEPHGNPWRG